MGVVAVLQLRQLVGFLILGVLLAVIWEVTDECIGRLGLLRRLHELLFLSVGLLSLFFFGQCLGEGELRVFMVLSATMGFAGTNYLFGCRIRRFLRFVGRVAVRCSAVVMGPVSAVFARAKKVKIFFKNLFANAKNWFTITDTQQEGKEKHTPFLHKGKRSGASNKIHDRSGCGGAFALCRRCGDTGDPAAGRGGKHRAAASGNGAGTGSSHSGVGVRYP
jgi:hypothetical protein